MCCVLCSFPCSNREVLGNLSTESCTDGYASSSLFWLHYAEGIECQLKISITYIFLTVFVLYCGDYYPFIKLIKTLNKQKISWKITKKRHLELSQGTQHAYLVEFSRVFLTHIISIITGMHNRPIGPSPSAQGSSHP